MPIDPRDAELEFDFPLDPHDLRPFTVDWEDVMLTSRVIASSTWELHADATAAGVQIHVDSHDNTTTTVWLKVNPANQEDAAFDPPGTYYSIKNTVTDDGSVAAVRERSFRFKVSQR